MPFENDNQMVFRFPFLSYTWCEKLFFLLMFFTVLFEMMIIDISIESTVFFLPFAPLNISYKKEMPLKVNFCHMILRQRIDAWLLPGWWHTSTYVIFHLGISKMSHRSMNKYLKNMVDCEFQMESHCHVLKTLIRRNPLHSVAS